MEVLSKETGFSGRLIRKLVLSGSGTYTVPTTQGSVPVSILVECIGGGAGGGGSAGAASSGGAGGGGGAGAYCSKFIAAPAASYPYAVGAAANGGAAGNNAGTAGNATTFGTTGAQGNAPGGSAGAGSGAAAATPLSVAGGAGGAVATNGDINTKGSPGDCGIRINATILMSGRGGDSIFGGAGESKVVTSAGVAGGSPGAGGSGGCSVNAATNSAGGNGAAGTIIISEFA
jgi:hypothetical protein